MDRDIKIAVPMTEDQLNSMLGLFIALKMNFSFPDAAQKEIDGFIDCLDSAYQELCSEF